MADCETNINEVEGRYGVAHQWVIGPQGEDDFSFYTGDEADVECVAQAGEEIHTGLVRVAFFGVTDKYDGWHWQTVLTSLEIWDEFVNDVWQQVESGELTNNEALQSLAETFMPDREWYEVRSIALAEHYG